MLAALIVFALSASVAARHTITGWEKTIFDAIYGWPAALRPAFWAITQLGSVWALMIVAALAYALQQKRLGFRILYVGIFAYLLVEVSKSLVMRLRPEFLLPGVVQREAFITGPGFPSGHTALVSAVGLIVLPYIPKQFRWLVPMAIVLVALSRVYLGVHAPLDVVGGFCVGVIAAASYYLGVSLAKKPLAKRKRKS
jgi:undecaprenyl-diphosphatase